MPRHKEQTTNTTRKASPSLIKNKNTREHGFVCGYCEAAPGSALLCPGELLGARLQHPGLCKFTWNEPRALLGLLFLTQRWHQHGEDSLCDRTRGKAEQQVYLQMGNISNTAFLSQKQSHGFSTRKQQWKTIWEPPALSHLSCLLALLLLLLEGRIVSFPLLSQFVGLGRDPREPQSEHDRGCRAPVPPKLHMEDGPHSTRIRMGYGEQPRGGTGSSGWPWSSLGTLGGTSTPSPGPGRSGRSEWVWEEPSPGCRWGPSLRTSRILRFFPNMIFL